ncbi:DUF3492 domain-containing protein, partial [Kitasatospora sp. NPDC004799]|uniref:DUF3492 domain-containing protein n=1 Tax=Kitasatospora sp. NPDC004799 TaxID=3154460 RepID=UPI0033B3F5F2
MRVALLTEGARPHPQRGAGSWCDRLAEGLPEHGFELYLLTGREGRGGGAQPLSGLEHGGDADPAVVGLGLRDGVGLLRAL